MSHSINQILLGVLLISWNTVKDSDTMYMSTANNSFIGYTMSTVTLDEYDSGVTNDSSDGISFSKTTIGY